MNKEPGEIKKSIATTSYSDNIIDSSEEALINDGLALNPKCRWLKGQVEGKTHLDHISNFELELAIK